MELPTVSNALSALGIQEWKIDGEDPTNEAEFLERFSKIIGVGANNTSIVSNNSNDFGVTWDQVSQKLSELTVEWNTKEYYRNRAEAYPPIGDQLDALFHAGAFSEDMAAQLAAVKAANPKPE
jgi:hypothetical protein